MVSSSKCDDSSRTLRNVEGRLMQLVVVMTISCFQFRASSMLTVFSSDVEGFMLCNAFLVVES